MARIFPNSKKRVLIFAVVTNFFWYLVLNTLLFRFQMIANLIKFQRHVSLEEIRVKLSDHFKTERKIITFFCVLSLLEFCWMIFIIVMICITYDRAEEEFKAKN